MTNMLEHWKPYKSNLEHLRHARDSIKLSNLIFHSSHLKMLHVDPSLGG